MIATPQLFAAGSAEETDAPILRVTDLKQHVYCPRIPYWTYLMPVDRRAPAKVQFGAENHALLAALEKRRTLREYGLREGRRLFRVRLASTRWGLTGILDALVETPDERIPIEYKDTLGGARLNHRIQLAAYALMLAETPGPPVRRGMIFTIPDARVHTVAIAPALLKQVIAALAEIRRGLRRELLPAPADSWAKCRDCEYLRFCNDRARPAGARSQEG